MVSLKGGVGNGGASLSQERRGGGNFELQHEAKQNAIFFSFIFLKSFRTNTCCAVPNTFPLQRLERERDEVPVVSCFVLSFVVCVCVFFFSHQCNSLTWRQQVSGDGRIGSWPWRRRSPGVSVVSDTVTHTYTHKLLCVSCSLLFPHTSPCFPRSPPQSFPPAFFLFLPFSPLYSRPEPALQPSQHAPPTFIPATRFA